MKECVSLIIGGGILALFAVAGLWISIYQQVEGLKEDGWLMESFMVIWACVGIGYAFNGFLCLLI